jgi:hypothetical protein
MINDEVFVKNLKNTEGVLYSSFINQQLSLLKILYLNQMLQS